MRTLYKTGRNADGFSLMEVLVATTVLIILVLMIARVSRQAFSSWESGYARAEGGMIVRGVMGTIQRELSEAVDGRVFGGVWSHNDAVHVTGKTIEFICLKKNEAGKREPWLVTYNAGSELRRDAARLKWSGNSWNESSDNQSGVIYYEDDASPYDATFNFEVLGGTTELAQKRGFETPDFGSEVIWNIPAVSIKVDLTRKSFLSGLSVKSFGRDGTDDTSDDIVIQ